MTRIYTCQDMCSDTGQFVRTLANFEKFFSVQWFWRNTVDPVENFFLAIAELTCNQNGQFEYNLRGDVMIVTSTHAVSIFNKLLTFSKLYF